MQKRQSWRNKSILIAKDKFHTSKVSIYAAEKSHMPWLNCGSADYQSSCSSQVDVCPMCKTINHSLMYMCLLLKEVKGHEKDHRS